MWRAIALLGTLCLVPWAPTRAQRPPARPVADQLGGSGYEPGGSNYQVYYFTPTYLSADNPGLEMAKAHAVEMVVGNYHLGVDTVEQQLRQMYQHGQRKVSLPLHFIREQDTCLFLTKAQCDDPAFAYEGDETQAINMRVHTTGPGDWHFSTQVYANLRSLSQRIAAIGFNELQIRFMPQSPYIKPTECAGDYDRSTPQGLWGLEKSVMDTLNHALQGSGVRVMFDLGGEFAGYQRETANSDLMGCGDGRVRTAMRFLWRKYVCRSFSDQGGDGWPFTTWTADSAVAHTVGFTFGNRVRRHGPNEQHNQVIVDQAIDVYDYAVLRDSTDATKGSGCGRHTRPAVYAFDLYPVGGGDNWGLAGCRRNCLDHGLFEEIGRQLIALGDYYQPIAVWEVPYDNQPMRDALVIAARDACLNIRTVMQWPAEWNGTRPILFGKPPTGVHFTLTVMPNYTYFLPACRSR